MVPRRSPLIASVLETIDERLSLPSCTESQMGDINRIPSRSVVGNYIEPLERLHEMSPLTNKHTSCIFGRDNNENSGI